MVLAPPYFLFPIPFSFIFWINIFAMKTINHSVWTPLRSKRVILINNYMEIISCWLRVRAVFLAFETLVLASKMAGKDTWNPNSQAVGLTKKTPFQASKNRILKLKWLLGEPHGSRTCNLLIKSQHSVLDLRNTLFSFKDGRERHLKSQQSGGRIISFPHYLLARF